MTGSTADLVHAARGPLMLITLGVLIAIDHVGAYRFGVTWPVLLVVFGLVTLLERAVRPPLPPPYPPPGYGAQSAAPPPAGGKTT